VQTAAPDPARVAEAKRSRDGARLAYDDFQARLYASHPRLRANRAEIAAASIGDVRQLLSGPSSALVEFVLGPGRAWVFVIDRSGARAFALPAGPRALARDVRAFREQLASRDLRADAAAGRLYDEVMRPAQAALAGKTELTIVPDGVLWDLPFQALRSAPDRYLIEEAAISYAPSATVLREAVLRQTAPRGSMTLLAFGNPTLDPLAKQRRTAVLMDDRLDPLPDAEDQVRQIGEIYGPSSRVYVGAEAREDRWKAEAAQHRILQLATHGVVDDRSPLYSYLVLARSGDGDREDGLLEAWEIMGMQLNANLVVLSACETARGQLSAGEGVVGLMWAFFVAGAPSTIVTQWKVESASSTALMLAFHRAWNGGRSGVSKARALQMASRQLLQTGEYRHPFFWAGYILAGDPR
jgi:CHAT domain-containing protein